MTIDIATFAALGVPTLLVDVLAREGKTEAFPIQADTLADTLAGRDVLGRGRTGSGKTLAFSLPLVARLGADRTPRRAGRPRALVLAPTRELATQISAVIAPLAAAYGLTTTTIFGGVSQVRQVAALQAGVDIVVACPGRLEDLMQQRHVKLDGIEITVLDEADHMADLGFLPGVTRIMTATPERGQRMLFSATLDNGVDKLVRRFLHDPKQHEVDEIDAPAPAMTHHVFAAADASTKKSLVHALASGTGRRILFLRTKHHAKRLARELIEAGIPAVDLHGNLSQAARDRNLAAFAAGSVRVLVATDVAARGVHVDDVELVVHVDPPTEHKAYLHRSGRTARAGAEGDVVTLVLPVEERDVQQMMRKAGIQVQAQRVTKDSEPVRTLVGEVAAIVKPSSIAIRPSVNGGGNGGAGRGNGGSAPRSGGSRRNGAGASRGNGSVSGASRGNGAGAAAPRAAGSAAGASAGASSAGSSNGGRRRSGGGGRATRPGGSTAYYSTSSSSDRTSR